MACTPAPKKPEIAYPCSWVYKLFGESEASLRQAVENTIVGCRYTLTTSRTSRNGRYRSMNLELVVVSEQDRLGVYEALNAHGDILLVL